MGDGPRQRGLLDEAHVALDRHAWEEARAAFEASCAEKETPNALEGLGWALFWLDRGDESLVTRERAFRLYREAGDARAAARVACGLAVDSADLRGEAPASGWLERARRLLEEIDPGPEHGWLALSEGHFALLYRRDIAAARESSVRALELGRRFGLVDLEMLARALQGLVLVAEGRVEDGMRCLDEATTAALAGEMGALNAVGATCCLLVHACERVRDYERAAQWSERVQRFSREWAIEPSLVVCRTQHAAMLIGRGEWADAERELIEAIERLAASRPLLVVEGIEQLAELRRRQGRFDEAEELFARVEGRSLALLGRAAMAWDNGDAATTTDLLERFLRRTPPDNWNGRAIALELLARARLALGQLVEAERSRVELRALADRIGTASVRAIVLVADGVFRVSRGEHEEARLDLARCLAGLDRVAAARQEARAALECFQRLRAAREASRAERLLAELAEQPALPSSSRPPEERILDAALTAREMEVLRLVAEGLGDKEIAERLFLSGHTVHRHISNIRLKLGLPSRAAAVAWAARNGFL
ncbi:MAG TPA: LuxR C-terminal-related transcriptional regulator [Vicinamibacteria bacterium]|nr:LuxR C-terminal-related transcriptional regulator [Vicinamibacteria bacterium]